MKLACIGFLILIQLIQSAINGQNVAGKLDSNCIEEYDDSHNDKAIPAENQTIGNRIKSGKDVPQTEVGSFVRRPTIYIIDGRDVVLTVTQDDTTGATSVLQSEYKKDKWDSK